jgi:hypothetical protein
MHEDQTERKSNKNAIDLKADQLQRLQLVELELACRESETLVSLRLIKPPPLLPSPSRPTRFADELLSPGEHLKDEQKEALLKLSKKKQSKRANIVEVEGEDEREPGKVIDLVEVLKRSLAPAKRHNAMECFSGS